MWLQAEKLSKSGAVFLDIRLADDYEEQHIKGAVNVPLFQPVQGNTFWDTTKRFVMATAFAMRATGGNLQRSLAASWEIERATIQFCAMCLQCSAHCVALAVNASDTCIFGKIMNLGLRGAERNPNFAEDAAKVLKKNQKIIVYCGIGGTIEVGVKPWAPDRTKSYDDPDRSFGRESRSLKACYELMVVGICRRRSVTMAGITFASMLTLNPKTYP